VLVGVLAGVAGLGLGLAALPVLGTTVALLFCVMGCLGVGNGATFGLVGTRFPERIGAMTGLVGAAGGLGGFLLPFGLGALRQLTGTFTLGFLVLAAAGAVTAAAVARRHRLWTGAPTLEVAT
jgi:NNP family nitrate/nitrite transporter-like MFS transporter